MTEYLSPAETARLVRAALKRSFPGVTFRVRTSVYAGGASIDVKYDGRTGFEPLRSCYCPDGPVTVEYDPNRCRECGYIGRLEPIYRPGMPRLEDVQAVAQPYAGGGFDGMVDLAYNKTVYLDADGNAVGGASGGTQGSRGIVPAYDTADTFRTASAAVRTVHPLADYIFVEPTL